MMAKSTLFELQFVRGKNILTLHKIIYKLVYNFEMFDSPSFSAADLNLALQATCTLKRRESPRLANCHAYLSMSIFLQHDHQTTLGVQTSTVNVYINHQYAISIFKFKLSLQEG